jgi:hypothetical protein
MSQDKESRSLVIAADILSSRISEHTSQRQRETLSAIMQKIQLLNLPNDLETSVLANTYNKNGKEFPQ